MSKGTIIYYGGFTLPDKSASANRVVSNGKIFDKLGYKTVFIGASDDSFDRLRPVEGYDDMFEHAHPKSTKQWLKHMISVEHIEAVMKNYDDVKKIILYNVPGRTGVNMCACTTQRLAKDFSNIVGIKEATGNVTQAAKLMNLTDGKIDLYSGEDAIVVPLLSIGGAGVISV